MLQLRAAAIVLSGMLLALACRPAIAQEDPSRIRRDETVILFPSYAEAEGDGWRVRIRGWVFELEPDSEWREEVVEEFGERLGLSEEQAEAPAFAARALPFLADNESGKRVGVEIAGEQYVMPPTPGGGHFSADVVITREQAHAAATPNRPGWITVGVTNAAEKADAPPGHVLLVPAEGLSVVSDIDDTIKVTGVGSTDLVLRRTFVEPFEAVPGMSELYQRLAGRGALFHYISGSPWQLYRPIAEFLEREGFPRGTFAMRRFRYKDRSIRSLLAAPEALKRSELAELLRTFPGRRFVLIGDTSERDPEVYGEIAREFPGRIALIAIRHVPGAKPQHERMAAAMGEFDRWVLFSDPSEIPLEGLRE